MFTLKYFSFSLSLLLSLILANDDNNMNNMNNMVTLQSSCNTIEQNGLYYIKPTIDGPVIPVLCSNGYTMIDISFDSNLESYPYYLSSWDYARGHSDHIIPNLDDISTFREWWSISDELTLFRVAENCEICESTDKYGDNSVYYTDGVMFCLTPYPISVYI